MSVSGEGVASDPAVTESKQAVPSPGPVTVVLSATRPRGFVFLCNNLTLSECFARHLFGLPSHHWSSVSSIAPWSAHEEPPTLIFLLNTSRPQLVFGVFVADGVPVYNAMPDAWEGRYPAQCRIRRVFNGVASVSVKLEVGTLDEPHTAQLCEAVGTTLRDVYDLAAGRTLKAAQEVTADPRTRADGNEEGAGKPARDEPAPEIDDAALPGYLLHCTPESWKVCMEEGVLAATRKHLRWLSPGLKPGHTQLFVLEKLTGHISGPYTCTGAATVMSTSEDPPQPCDFTPAFSFPARIPFAATSLPFVPLPAAISTFVGVGRLSSEQVTVLSDIIAGKPLTPEGVTAMCTRHKVWQKRQSHGQHFGSRAPRGRRHHVSSEVSGLTASIAAVAVTTPQ